MPVYHSSNAARATSANTEAKCTEYKRSPRRASRGPWLLRVCASPLPARIASFLQNAAPNAYCDICLATALGLAVTLVARETSILGRESGFTRSRDVCMLCAAVEQVIASLP